MKRFWIVLLFLGLSYSGMASGKKTGPGNTGGNGGGHESDSSASVKSNIVLFKMLTTPPSSNNNGSLKKAGKVARTSTSSTKNPYLPAEE